VNFVALLLHNKSQIKIIQQNNEIKLYYQQ